MIDLSNLPDFIGHEGATEEEIRAAETALGLRFADDYRDYLRTYGFATVDGHELSGICSHPQRNVISLTEEEWSLNPEINKELYVIEVTGFDGGVVWQNSSGDVLIHYPNEGFTRLANSLFTYLTD